MKETDFLICPICGSPLQRAGNSFLCTSRDGTKKHCFDLSSSGYSDLSYRSGGGGDPKDAVNDRTAFLEKGYYEPLSNEINRLCSLYLSEPFLLVDAGCGEGYYSERIARELEGSFIFGADLSKHAVHKASVRRNMRGGRNSFFAVASIFSLPVASSSADAVLSMFAPISEEETLRILKDDGIFIAGAAGCRHLYDLKDAIYDEVYLNDERADLPKQMTLIDKTTVAYRTEISNHEDIIRLFGMTPYRFRTSEASIQKLNELTDIDVEINVDFYVFRK